MLKFMLRKTICVFVSASMMLSVSATITNSAYADTTGASNIQAELFVSSSGSDANPGTYEMPLATLDGARKAVETINGDMTGDIYVFFEPGTYYTPNTVNFTTADSGTNGHHVIYKTLGAPGSAQFVGGMKASSVWTQVPASANPNSPDSDMQQSLVGQIYKTNLNAQLGALFPGGLPATSGSLPNNLNGKFDVNTLYVNDTRATQARTLNSNKYPGYPSTLLENPLYSAGGSYSAMQYKASDANTINTQALINAQTRGDLSVQYVGNDIGNGRSWETNTLPVQSINTTTRTLTYNPNDTGTFSAADGAFASYYYIGSNSRYFLQGNLAYLDTPGEFYYNAKSGDLYYYPTSAQTDLSAQDIVIPTTESIVNIKGNRTGIWDSTVITPVKNITFDGLGFEDTSFPDYYSPSWGWLQYGVSTRGFAFPSYAVNSSNPIYSGQSDRPQYQVGNITVENADSITITNAHIKNAGMYGVILKTGVTNSVVKNSLIEYCGYGGVQIEGGYPGVDGNSDAVSFTNHNLIENDVIHDVGQLVLQASSVTISNATYNTVTHIETYNSPRRAFMLIGGNVQGWNNTGPSGGRNYSPNAFVLSRDQYTHHNTFSNIYAHNVQQDGTDDGAIMTAFLYYPADNYSQPNYYNQIVVDNVAYNPQLANQGMTNISPNNINFDMGWVNLNVSNVKSVNPQHYNIENDHLQDGQVKVTNSNFYFRNANDGLSNFDDSKMDYSNIGVLPSSFPSAYSSAITKTKVDTPSNLYFGENFEDGIDLSKWSYSGALPTINRLYMSEGGFGGKSSLEINASGASKPVLYRNFANNLNKKVSVKIFDNFSTDHTTYGSGYAITYAGKTFARADDGTNVVGLGIDPGATNGAQKYVMNIGGVGTPTNVLRTNGWHTLSFDYSTPGTIVLSVDGTIVNTLNSATWANTPNSFNYVSLGSPDGTGDNFYDEFYIYGGQDAPIVQPNVASGGTIPPYTPPSSNPLINWDFESGTMPVTQSTTSSTGPTTLNANGFTNFFNGNLSVVSNPLKTDSGNSYTTNTSNSVMQISGGVSLYAPQPLPTWSNYTYDIKYMLKSWIGIATNDMLGFNVYEQQPTSNSLQYNPATYQVVLVRNKSGTGNAFSLPNDGSPYLLLRQITPNANIAWLKLPESFANTSEWHSLSVSFNNGNISATLDGQYSVTAQSNTFTSGTIGFYTFNSTAYFDNINITPSQPDMMIDANLKLGNATLNGMFNPDYKTYTAAIADHAQPVTIVMPTAATTGTTYSISLNGTDITSRFPDTMTPVALSLVHGTNILTITQKTQSGTTTNYTVSILKPYTSATADPIAPISTTVGVKPTLPATTTVHFDDGGTDQISINWHMVDRSIINNPGTYTVFGKLSGIGLQISATVKVEGVTSVSALPDVSTSVGNAPALAQNVTLNYEFAGATPTAVTFDSLDPSLYAQAGTIFAVGHVNQYAGEVLQKVTVLPVSVSPQATLTNQQQVIAGEAMDLTMGLRNVTQSEFHLINAQDLTLTYDAAKMQLGTVTSLVYGLQVIVQQETIPGHVQIILATTNPDGFVAQGDLLKFRFTAKAVTQATTTSFGVSSFTIANGLGNELQINGASSSTQIIVPTVTVDKTALNTLMTSAQAKLDAAEEGNNDGQYVTGSKGILQSAILAASVAANDPNVTQVQVNNAKDALAAAVQAFEDNKIIADINGNGTVSIGDLAIISSSYGKQPGQIGWNAKADVNKDGKVDVEDLAIVAKAILH